MEGHEGEGGDAEDDADEETLAERASKDPDLNGKMENSETTANRLMDKPLPTIKAEEVKSGSDTPHDSQQKYTYFDNKRLCERWLDNLFMVLYEDLRIYTIWRTEMAQYRQQQMQYKKSAAEWEILGDLAERLHHTNEALEAYQQCLNIRFSPKAMKGTLKMYEKKHDTKSILACLIRLITWQYRWYSEVSSYSLRSIHSLTSISSRLTCFTRYES